MTVADDLAGVIDRDAISTDAADLAAHARDLWPRSLLLDRAGTNSLNLDCVVRPRTQEEVSEVVSWAQASRTPVVPFGGGSGVCGGIAADGGIALDLTALDAIVELDETSLLVTAQAGVAGPRLTRHLDERDLLLGHEPQSLAISTVGGWLATRACGQLSARYGGIERLIAGFVAVLPTGTIARWKPAPRRATGPDIGALLLGSEGALGVITEATLRVSKKPVTRTDRCLSFERMADGVAACRAIAQSDLRPTLVRLYDREDTFLLLRNEPEPVSGPILLLSFDGSLHEERAQRALELCGGLREEDRHVAHWWEHRNDAVDDYRSTMAGEGVLGPHGVVDTMEVSGTWSVLRDLYHSTKEALAAQADFVGCHVSHVYPDGACLYFTLASACASDEEAIEVNERWWRTGMKACLAAGGSISHHHGIGRLKAPWLGEELGEWRATLALVKKALDPGGIMNPGVLGL